jgi:hypothetical protein
MNQPSEQKVEHKNDLTLTLNPKIKTPEALDVYIPCNHLELVAPNIQIRSPLRWQ